jgi:hypothetical protein
MAAIIEPNAEEPANIPSRAGVSPIGTTSPNTGSSADTNSTYAQGAFASGIAQESGTSYTVQNTDYQGIIQFNNTSAIAVTLNSTVKPNFTCNILNFGTGAITLTTSDGSAINQGASSLTLAAHQGCTIYYANRAWTAFIGSTIIPVVPANTAAVAGEYLTGYNSSTGAFSVSTPAGVSGTVPLAKVTVGGTDGSLTVTAGIITAIVNPT